MKNLPDNYTLKSERSITVATGFAAYSLIEYCAREVEKKVSNIQINVVKIQNRLFGERITAENTDFEVINCDITSFTSLNEAVSLLDKLKNLYDLISQKDLS